MGTVITANIMGRVVCVPGKGEAGVLFSVPSNDCRYIVSLAEQTSDPNICEGMFVPVSHDDMFITAMFDISKLEEALGRAVDRERLFYVVAKEEEPAGSETPGSVVSAGPVEVLYDPTDDCEALIEQKFAEAEKAHAQQAKETPDA